MCKKIFYSVKKNKKACINLLKKCISITCLLLILNIYIVNFQIEIFRIVGIIMNLSNQIKEKQNKTYYCLYMMNKLYNLCM